MKVFVKIGKIFDTDAFSAALAETPKVRRIALNPEAAQITGESAVPAAVFS